MRERRPIPGVVVLGSDFKALGVIRSLGRHGIPGIVVDSQPRSAWFSRYVTRRFTWQGSLEEPALADYLVQIGLLDRSKVPSADKDTGLLLRQAMDKVAFLPFGLLVDKWRWGVFDGSITPANYNQAWVDLKRQYQGITPPVARSEADFDPGAKFHIPGNTPYARYFLARILQFQFYKAACDMSGWKGPLHRCSFYGNKQVGERLNAMLSSLWGSISTARASLMWRPEPQPPTPGAMTTRARSPFRAPRRSRPRQVTGSTSWIQCPVVRSAT